MHISSSSISRGTGCGRSALALPRACILLLI
jgi:hypothetical protein